SSKFALTLLPTCLSPALIFASFAIILPPVGVFLERGCGADFLINIVLTCLGYMYAFNHTRFLCHSLTLVFLAPVPESSMPCTSFSSTKLRLAERPTSPPRHHDFRTIVVVFSPSL
ncbi:Plasma membrane proteolipid 3, partial [Grifola frondosa]